MDRLEVVDCVVLDMCKIMIVENASSCIKNYTQLFEFDLQFRIL